MRALTVQQPYAWAVCVGGKTVENRSDRRGELQAVRSWSRASGHTVAVHTSRRDAGQDAYRLVRNLSSVEVSLPSGGSRPTVWAYGAVIATALVTGVHGASACYDPASGRYCSPWAEPHAAHLVLDDVRVLHRPVEARGQLGLWEIADTTVLAEIRRQLA